MVASPTHPLCPQGPFCTYCNGRYNMCRSILLHLARSEVRTCFFLPLSSCPNDDAIKRAGRETGPARASYTRRIFFNRTSSVSISPNDIMRKRSGTNIAPPISPRSCWEKYGSSAGCICIGQSVCLSRACSRNIFFPLRLFVVREVLTVPP